MKQLHQLDYKYEKLIKQREAEQEAIEFFQSLNTIEDYLAIIITFLIINMIFNIINKINR